MTTVAPTPPAAPTTIPEHAGPIPPRRPAIRDQGIDLVRALCVLAVMILHALQVAVSVDAASGPILEYATRGAAWYPPVTWMLQVLPLFFVIGGFSGSIAYRRLRERGGGATDFARSRMRRLLVPAVPVLAVVGGAFSALSTLGVDAELLRETGLRFAQPLWFLGVFLGCQLLLPSLLRAHERAPHRSLAALVAGAVVVDLLREASGIEAIGALNLALVWLTLQQLGFFLAEGRIDALSLQRRAVTGAAAILVLATLIGTGVHSPDLIAHLNPPTTALLLLGLAQTMLLSLLRGWVSRLSATPTLGALTAMVTARTMELYLWNLPVLLGMALTLGALGEWGMLSVPEVASTSWWLSRPLWIGVSILLTLAVAQMIGGLERRPMPATPTTSTPLATGAAVVGNRSGC